MLLVAGNLMAQAPVPIAGATMVHSVASPLLPRPQTLHVIGGVTYADHSFEGPTKTAGVVMGTNEVHDPAAPGAITYPPGGGWTWTGAKVAGQHSILAVSTNGAPPHGDFVLALESTTAPVGVAIPFFFPTSNVANPNWRFSFLAAQRHAAAAHDQQRVKVVVTIGSVSTTIYDDVIRDGIYRRHVTRPFAAPASTGTFTSGGTITISGMVTLGAGSPQVALLDQLELREVLDFGSSSTWVGGFVPGGGQDARIPADSCVGVTNAALNSLDILGELLVLNGPTAATQYTLSTRAVNVRTVTGMFQVGTAGVPYLNRFALVLDDDTTGSHDDINGLRVFDRGWVEMHGVPRASWGRLVADAEPGTEIIDVVDALADWVVGDRIVIASSDRDFRHAEEAVITATAVVSGARQLALAQPLQHFHCGQVRTINGNYNPLRTLDQRAEVGLLSRNVRVVAIPRTANGTPGYGGHIMISDMGYMVSPGGPTGIDGGFGRFSGVELDNMGRIGQSGRYPMHWHLLMKQGKGQYFRDGSIHHSNNRVVAVHLTDGARFEGNVGYLHPGHGVLIEDGSEEDNDFIGNLVLGTRVPDDGFALLGSDTNNFDPANQTKDLFQNRSPATFWITNPNNRFVGNVAAGSEGVGYWFALPTERMGLTNVLETSSPANPHVVSHLSARALPNRQVLGAFEDNVCHSSWMGFDVNDGVRWFDQTYPSDIDKNITWRPTDANGTRVVQTLPDFVAYCCNVGLYTGNGDQNLRFEQAMLADNTWAVAMASHDTLTDSAIVCDTGSGLWAQADPAIAPDYSPIPRTAVIFYDGAATLSNIKMFGYDTTGNGATGCTTFQVVGAARRRTNWPLSQFQCYPTLNATATVAPHLASIQDYGVHGLGQPSPTPPELNPGQWAIALDNWDRTLMPPSPANVTTIVTRHPMMLTGNEASLAVFNEYPLPVSGSTGRLLGSTFRFGYLRTFEATYDGQGRLASSSRHSDLRYDREHFVGTVPPTLTWEDRWAGNEPYHQIAVIADRAGENNGYRYLLNWIQANPQNWGAPGQPTAPPTTSANLQLSGLQAGDSVLLGLRNYVANPQQSTLDVQLPTGIDGNGAPQFAPQGSPVSVLTGTSLAQLGPTAPSTIAFAETSTGILWIRIKIPAAGLANDQGDGRGQALRILR